MIDTEINIIGIAFSEGRINFNWSSQTPHKTTTSTIATTTVSTKSIALLELSLCTLYLLLTLPKKPNSTLVAMFCKRESKLDLKQRKIHRLILFIGICTLMLNVQ